MDSLFSLEKNYDAAKARLQAAQQEKLEAAAEFLSARAALRQTLEALWPSPCECGGPGYQGDAGRLPKDPAATEEAKTRPSLVRMRSTAV